MSKMKSKSIIPILTTFIAFLFVLTQATNPGLRLRITDKGLQYGKCPPRRSPKHFLPVHFIANFVSGQLTLFNPPYRYFSHFPRYGFGYLPRKLERIDSLNMTDKTFRFFGHILSLLCEKCLQRQITKV